MSARRVRWTRPVLAHRDIATLWWILLAGGTAVFLLVVVLFMVPLLRRGRDEGADRGDVPAARQPGGSSGWASSCRRSC